MNSATTEPRVPMSPATLDRDQPMFTTLSEVINEGFCIGCGSCAFSAPESLRMQVQPSGHWQPVMLDRRAEGNPMQLLQRCPMSGVGPDEDEIARALYPQLPVNAQTGRYGRSLVGHVDDEGYRDAGGSGGMVSWLLVELLRRREVDAVLHVTPAAADDPDGLLFRYAVSDNETAVRRGAKSRYYPVEMSGVLRQLTEDGRRFAVVGLPCFVKAARLLQRDGLIAPDKVKFCIGLVCGHLKSLHFASYLAWQKGIEPNRLTGFDFRRKLPGRPASAYGFAASWQAPGNGGTLETVHPMDTVQGRDWGEGLMKNPACEFCDDVMAECADIVVGDAWLPDYVDEWRGTNVVAIRDARLDLIVAQAEAEGRLVMAALSIDDLIKSQAAGLRHRREGLAHRLARRRAAGLRSPKKRVEPELAASRDRQGIYDLRLQIAQRSSAAFAETVAAGQLAPFEQQMKPLLRSYHRLVRGSLLRRAWAKGRRVLARLWHASFARAPARRSGAS